MKFLTKKAAERLRKYEIKEAAADIFYTTTPDGWELAISHYQPLENVEQKPTPVLLCHGLGSNRITFDIDEQNSLVKPLLQAGYNVYSMELRGHGLSQKAGQEGKTYGWGFFDYLKQDFPCALAAVKAHANVEQFHYIGHSMGGILLLCHTAISDFLPFKSAITVASSLDYSESRTIFKKIIKILPLSKMIPAVPIQLTTELSAMLSRFSRKFIDKTLVYPANMDTQTYIKLAMNNFGPESSPVMIDLSAAITGEQLGDEQGPFLKRLHEKTEPYPILSIAGSRDWICPEEATKAHGCEWVGFGKAYGQKEHYGHVDLLQGKYVREEVYPTIFDWLAKHDG